MRIKSTLIVLLALLLSTSLVLNYIFYKSAFIPLHAVKLDPIGLNYYPASTSYEREESDKTKVMFYGDSRGLSWPDPKDIQHHFVNRSIGNQTSIQIVERFKQHVTPHNPKIIIVQMCVNDLKMIPLFLGKKERIIEDCKRNLENLVKQAHEIEARVILTTVFPLGDISIARKMLGISEQPIIEAIDEINLHIKSLETKDTAVFDSYDLLVGSDRKVNPDYSSDWLHLNEKGYQLLNQYLEKSIQ